MAQEIPFISAFPTGNPLPEMFSKYFIGQAWLAPLTEKSELHSPVCNVTFSPSCRNNWHSHTGGQMLIAVGGRGYYQEQGRPARLLVPGDVVEIAPGVVHWHGAAPDSWFSHLAVQTNPQTNENTWLDPVDDHQYAAAVGALESAVDAEATTDPEMTLIETRFIGRDVRGHGQLCTRLRAMVVMASCIAQQGHEEYKRQLCEALDADVSPVEAREVLYHCLPYVGLAKVRDFVSLCNAELSRRGISLPLPAQGTTDDQNRFSCGLAVQKSIFGVQIEEMRRDAPEELRHIQDYLSANCFGDYYTRRGLDVRTRELLTFAILLSMGGSELQLKAHIRGNDNVGNSREVLIDTVTQLVPFVGYPRSLSAIACINEVLPHK